MVTGSVVEVVIVGKEGAEVFLCFISCFVLPGTGSVLYACISSLLFDTIIGMSFGFLSHLSSIDSTLSCGSKTT